MKKRIYLQWFAEGAEGGAEGAEGAQQNEGGKGTSAQEKGGNEAKYTDADVDRLISQKFAEWQKKQEKKAEEVSEVEQLSLF